MLYKLRRDYIIRGWKKMAWMLLHIPDYKCRVLNYEEFQVLLLCDGRTECDSSLITDGMRGILKNLKKDGIIEEVQGYGVLDDQQYYRYYDNRFVRSVFWSITGRCNYQCRHCFMDAPESALGELSHEQAIHLIDQMAECGVLRVDITGGEPFVRQDFWSLIDRIQYHKMTIGQVYTNGWLLSPAVLDKFEKRNLKPEISISFDGIGWHDWMRGVSGAEDAAIRALRLCKERGFPMNVEMCLHKGNRETLRETVTLLADIGVPSMKVGNVMETELWKGNSEGNALDNRAYTEAVLRYIPYFYLDGAPVQIMFSGVVALSKKSKDYKIIPVRYDGTEGCLDRLLCGAARYACYITPEGRLLPCMPMTACKEQEQFPLVQEIGLKQGLSDSFYMNIVDSRVEDLLAANPKCDACDHKYQCGGGCRATALERTGNLMGCDGVQCQLWEEGYVERIRETVEAAIARYCTDGEEVS